MGGDSSNAFPFPSKAFPVRSGGQGQGQGVGSPTERNKQKGDKG